MKIVRLNTEKEQFYVPGFGYRELKNLQEFKDDDKFGIALKSYFPHAVYEASNNIVKEEVKVEIKKEEPKVELLVEEPVEVLEVEEIKEETVEAPKRGRAKK